MIGRAALGLVAAAALFVLWNLAGAPGHTPTLPLDDPAPEGQPTARPAAAPPATAPGLTTRTLRVNGINLFYREIGTDDADEAAARYRGREQQLILWFMNSRSHARRTTAQDVSGYVESFRRDRGLRGPEGAGDLLGKQLKAKGLSQVQSVLIPDAGHWLFEEQPERTSEALLRFIEAKPPS